jgi:ATP-dependent RNA/DNA helicase IGHMBP2
MILRAAITNRVTKTVSGVDRDYAPVCADLKDGWTVTAPEEFAERPAYARLIGRRHTYIAVLDEGQLVLIGARARRAWDGSEEEVARYPRCYEQVIQSHDRLDPQTWATLIERWNRAHSQREAERNDHIARWLGLNRIRAFVAREHGAVVRLSEPAWDPERLEEGQLVLRTEGPAAAEAAVKEFVYRLPNLDVPLRVEDVGEEELVVDCGEEDLVRVERYLKNRGGKSNGKPLRITLDREETDKQIEREKWTLQDAERDARLKTLISDPRLARVTANRKPTGWFNPNLDAGQRAVVSAASEADDVLVVQGPPGTGKTTAICEIVRQALSRDPRAQILLAAQTHQAIDNVLLRLAEEDPDLPIARVASVHTVERVNATIRDRYWIESDEPWEPPIVRRALSYRRLIDAQTRAGDRGADEVTRAVLAIQADYLSSVGPQQTPQERLAQARVIAGTCAGVRSNQDVRARRFALAIVEEAGKATPPEALMAMVRARKSILVGDSRQLPPHVWDPMREVLRQPKQLQTTDTNREGEANELRAQIQTLGDTPDARERAGQETLFDHFSQRLRGTGSEATLHTQYRMAPEIGELVSRVFYADAGGLRHGRVTPVDPRVQAFAKGTRVKLVDVRGPEQREGKSKYRTAEVAHIRGELQSLQEHAAKVGPPANGPERLGVAIITPYAAQARRLRASIDTTRYPALKVRIGIVDRFQGDEDQVVILSIAATTVAGFLKVPNRINVAVSRAQDLLILTTSVGAALDGKIGRPLQNVARFVLQRAEEDHPGYEVARASKPRRRARQSPRRAESGRTR